MSRAAAGAEERLLTLEEFEKLPADEEGYRYELVRGRLVREPPPNDEHRWLDARLARYLVELLEAHGLGRVFSKKGGIRCAP